MSASLESALTASGRVPTAPPSSSSLWIVVVYGLRRQRRAPLTWGGGIGALGALMAAIWPSIEGSIETLMRSYPEGLKTAFGIQQLDSVEKYIDAELLSLIVPLALAFFAIRCATRPTVGAEDRGQLDSLLSLPLSRYVLVAGSSIVMGIVVLEILIVSWALTMLAGTIAGTGISALNLAAGFLNVWPIAFAFGGLGTFVAGLTHRPTVVTAIATATLIGMYVIDLVGKLAHPVSPLRVISAFRYYGSAIQSGIDATHLLLLCGAGVLLAALGAISFERRDVL